MEPVSVSLDVNRQRLHSTAHNCMMCPRVHLDTDLIVFVYPDLKHETSFQIPTVTLTVLQTVGNVLISQSVLLVNIMHIRVGPMQKIAIQMSKHTYINTCIHPYIHT